jgi:hypothetical protein
MKDENYISKQYIQAFVSAQHKYTTLRKFKEIIKNFDRNKALAELLELLKQNIHISTASANNAEYLLRKK